MVGYSDQQSHLMINCCDNIKVNFEMKLKELNI